MTDFLSHGLVKIVVLCGKSPYGLKRSVIYSTDRKFVFGLELPFGEEFGRLKRGGGKRSVTNYSSQNQHWRSSSFFLLPYTSGLVFSINYHSCQLKMHSKFHSSQWYFSFSHSSAIKV
uniref:Uncharacterized protein n=1 Tax=Micrurus surinamensis TaxID=129470 RepID=A0A2D4Q633_MICSU